MDVHGLLSASSILPVLTNSSMFCGFNQETGRMLSKGAVMGKHDELRGLSGEHVIV
jgi:hypothetical protein